MSSERDPRELVAEVLTATSVASEHVPRLLTLLDVGDRQVRLGAAAALCVVADEHPKTVAGLAGRLADRAEETLAAALALEYVADLYPAVVEEQLDQREMADGPRHRVERSGPTPGGTRDREVGRTRVAGDETESDPRQVYADDGEGDSPDGAAGEEGGNTIGQRPKAADAEWRSLVEYESKFDRLAILAPRERRRYGDTYRTLGVLGETEYAVALRLLDGAAGGQSFGAALADPLGTWQSVGDVEGVLTLYDWSDEPRPWLATEYTEERLADCDRFPTAEAAWHAERLATAVTTLHERGVVHAGIDADAVAYYGNVLTAEDRQPPLLDTPGLLSVYRHRADPAQFLDPRYAAPEYYERRFGRVDHATDIYQLGAVCYRLFTGDPPYTGSFESVREQVLSDELPRPTAVADVPDAVDDIVGKAMAPQKLTRYETAAHLRQELRSLGGGDD